MLFLKFHVGGGNDGIPILGWDGTSGTGER